MEANIFTCSICGEASRDICLFCTKDACSNHLCERCSLCSDCCTCEMPVFNEMSHVAAPIWHQCEAISESASDSTGSLEIANGVPTLEPRV